MLDKLETQSGKNNAIYNVKPGTSGSQGIEGSPGSFYGRSSRRRDIHSRDDSIGIDSTRLNENSKPGSRDNTNPRKAR